MEHKSPNEISWPLWGGGVALRDCCHLSRPPAPSGRAGFWKSCSRGGSLPYSNCRKATTARNIAFFFGLVFFFLLPTSKASFFTDFSGRVGRGRDVFEQKHPSSPASLLLLPPILSLLSARLNATAEKEIEFWCLCSQRLLSAGEMHHPAGLPC